MPIPCQLISANMLLQTQLKGVLGPIDVAATDAATAASSKEIAEAPRDMLLVVDAQVPPQASASSDPSEETCLGLLRNLRDRGVDRPTLVITSHPMGISALDDYCNPDNRAIALPLRRLQPSTLDAFTRMLLDPPKPTWNVIEIDVKRDRAICYLCSRDGKQRIQWSEAATGYHAVQRLALQYARPDFSPGWARRFHDDGASLFYELVVRTLGTSLFAHLEQAAGGLRRLAFRFLVEDATLYTAPFEGAVRIAVEPSATQDDFTQEPFVLINAPITRRMKGAILRATDPAQGLPRPARLLFVRSQVGDSPAGQTDADIVKVPEIDHTTGRTRIKHMEFRRLENIDRELADLKTLAVRSGGLLAIDKIDLSDKADNPGGCDGAEGALLSKLKRGRYDIVHFAGHSLTTKDALTLLVLPSDRLGEAEAVAVETFANAAADGGARLVYLSSCQGSSANTVASLAQRGVPHVMGFRWNVEDDRAADFAQLFYAELFGSPPAAICAAFRAACQGVYKPQQIELSPIWASPILAMRSDDWAVSGALQEILEGP